MDDDIDLQLRHNAAESRYEGQTAGLLAVCDYELEGDTMTFHYVYVPPPIEGLGIGTRVVRYGVEDARSRGLFVIPRCPFVLHFFRTNPEYADVVSPRLRSLVNRARD